MSQIKRHNGVVDTLAGGGLDLMALLPCPVKIPFEQAFEEFLGEHSEVAKDLLYCLEGHVNHHLSFYTQLEQAQMRHDVPNILVTPGVNRFMGRDFRNKFVSDDIFAREQDYFNRPESSQNEFVDPMGYYFLLAINPLVIVVDHTRLEGRPTPLRWSDLLLPHYHQQIVMRAQKDIFCETVLFSFYKEFRIDGIKQLARNVRIGCHPAEMTKHVGSTKPDWPAISLMPYFFAKTIRNSDKMTIIWPFDGAIASPITMMVQRTALPDFQLVIDFLTGSVMAKLWSNAFFFPPFAGSSPSIENNRRLKWLGWDFIHSIDAHELFEHLNDVFCQAMQDVSKEVQ